MKLSSVENCIGHAKRVAKAFVFRNAIPCFWSKSDNWGDALTPYLVERISGIPARHDANPLCWKHFVIGSILDRGDRYSIVWGTGMISPEALPTAQPHAIYAVRGPLTREKLVQAGIPCPSVFGDPALLLPRYFKPPRMAKWKIGVIPHYTDQEHPWIKTVRHEADVNVINIQADIEEFVHQVLSCECILSSSLHGLICADSYGIANRRIVLHDQLIGGDFKFQDYYLSLGLSPEVPLRPRPGEEARDLIPAISRQGVHRELDQLLGACPFRR